MAISLALAVLCVALKDVNTTLLDVFNGRSWLEENIYW
jgi:hypothetical protein